MAPTAKTLAIDKCTLNGDWTVVLPRLGRRRRKATKFETLEEKQEPWTPTDLQTDPCREAALMQKMENCINKLASSPFYQTLQNEVQSWPISHHFNRVLSSEFKIQMVIYGIGSIESYKPSRLLLGLAILLRRHLNWTGNIEVFDPILSATESRVLEALGCSVMSIIEHGRRQALKPTMFFMPHCEAELYNNLLQANWKVNLLSNMVLFGNSFGTYQQISRVQELACSELSRTQQNMFWLLEDSQMNLESRRQYQIITIMLFMIQAGIFSALSSRQTCNLSIRHRFT